MKYLLLYLPYNVKIFMAVIFSDFNLRGSETDIFFYADSQVPEFGTTQLLYWLGYGLDNRR